MARRSIPPRSPAPPTRCSSASISTAASSRSQCSCHGRDRRRSSGSMPLPRRGRGSVHGAEERPSAGAGRRRRRRRPARHPPARGDEAQEPVVSIDGLELKEFDYIDIGTMLEGSGAVPVVIKSLIFPGSVRRKSRSSPPRSAAHQQHHAERRNRAAGRARSETHRHAVGRKADGDADQCSMRVARDEARRIGQRRRIRRQLDAVAVAMQRREQPDQRQANRERWPQRQSDRRAEHQHRAAMPISTQGSATPPKPSAAPAAITTGNVSGSSHNARPPSCDAHRPTATIASNGRGR